MTGSAAAPPPQLDEDRVPLLRAEPKNPSIINNISSWYKQQKRATLEHATRMAYKLHEKVFPNVPNRAGIPLSEILQQLMLKLPDESIALINKEVEKTRRITSEVNDKAAEAKGKVVSFKRNTLTVDNARTLLRRSRSLPTKAVECARKQFTPEVKEAMISNSILILMFLFEVVKAVVLAPGRGSLLFLQMIAES